MLAQLAGYKKDVVEVNNVLVVGNMADSNLLERLNDLEAQLRNRRTQIAMEKVRRIDELEASRDDTIIDVETQEKNDEHGKRVEDEA